MKREIEYKDFEQCINETFEVALGNTAYVEMTLEEMTVSNASGVDYLSMFLCCDECNEVPKGTYTVSNEKFGKQNLFITPVHKNHGIVTYQIEIPA